jgi:protein-S-isoprenylcysteine O-methyltransferase Ste14
LDSGTVLWPHVLAVRIAGDAVALCGLVVTLWARTVLGGNWSGVPVIKEGHELIDRGPYAHVRHPIYSGVLLMFLGLAILLGTVNAFAVLVVIFVGLRLKARKEEKLLTAHFPDAYLKYKARTKALIPSVF